MPEEAGLHVSSFAYNSFYPVVVSVVSTHFEICFVGVCGMRSGKNIEVSVIRENISICTECVSVETVSSAPTAV
jgi:hypothetical protein